MVEENLYYCFVAEVQPTGFLYDGVYHEVQEMVPEIVVPELTDFKVIER